MILLTLDPLTKSAGILSIPRDMWVAIPGFQHGKINTAYFLGDAYKLPGGGPGLAVKTVEQFIGVPVNYYAQVDFETFVKFIDEIGGVKIDVPARLRIDLLGGGPKTQKVLQPGVQVLPGEWALAYARQRYTQNGDFDRANRQQQVIMAIRDKLLSPSTWPVLLAKAPTLYAELSSGIQTNMTLQQAMQLAQLAREVTSDHIQRGVLDTGYTLYGRSPDNLSILIPIPDKIHLLRDQIFAASDSLGPQTPGNPQEQMKAEAARVAVYNGSAASDLGSRAADFLRQQGMNVTETGDAGKRYGATTLVDHTGSPYTLKYLLETLKVQPGNVLFNYDPNNAVDVEVFLGDDARGALP
ncbi:MAG TPA: LCP family protein [Anaerolineales bacterium]